MIKITQTEIFGFGAAIRGMRNPKNSWIKSDSNGYNVGPNDHKLMMNLRNAGSDHGKFMRMIHVQCDIIAPLYWWKEYDTYKVGTVADSCSTMHKIQAKKFLIDDFSTEHMGEAEFDLLLKTLTILDHNRRLFLETKNKDYWWQMIQLLPTSYNQLRTVDLNYEVLRNMYKSRKDHKLDEWHEFCDWIKTLPYSDLITGEVQE